MESFRAFRIHGPGGGDDARLETIGLDDLSDGEVVIRGEYSSINYKDALAATGAGKILRRYPLVGGVDIAGTVVSSSDPRVPAGARVAVCGCGLSETRDGGFAEYARVPGDCVNLLPEGLDTRSAMALGTAGFTAALAIQRMQDNEQQPDQGPVAVTGATGGVGSFAINMLARLGFEAVAVTGKATQAADYLQELGAREILDLKQVDFGSRPLEKAQWGGAIDNLGGEPLAWLTRTLKPHGNIASIGLAASHELHTTVMPFILRGINLLGIDSNNVPLAKRERLWQRLATDLRPPALDRIACREIGLAELPGHFQAHIDGRITGRTLVRLR
ncbi:MAG: acryloyl-CoA reductase [Gammaproteobacteria bacterium]|nr:MAG: acryloyl-CoA reductase [Gammaproteobacteria bacterium]